MTESTLHEHSHEVLVRILGTDYIPSELLAEAKHVQSLWHRVGSGPMPDGLILTIVAAHVRPESPQPTNGHQPRAATNGTVPEEPQETWLPTEIRPGDGTEIGTKVVALRDGVVRVGEWKGKDKKTGNPRVKFDGEKKFQQFDHDQVRVAKRG